MSRPEACVQICLTSAGMGCDRGLAESGLRPFITAKRCATIDSVVRYQRWAKGHLSADEPIV